MTEQGKPLPFRYKLASRLARLLVGLLLYGASIQFMIASRLGNQPWSVLDQGIARHTGLTVGTIVVIVAGLVLICWIPLRQWPGLGTIANMLIIGPSVDLTARFLPEPHAMLPRISYMVVGVLLCAVATGLYIGAQFGPGPRDGLMTGLARRGLSIRLARTLIEITVVALGFLLGGTFGAGTILFAVAIGPLAQIFLPVFAVRRAPEPIPQPA
ncbi:membrane protein YczE [Hamadaea tsunoensis]|uniref:membrane protein YczE n=1 Tax=Hamadaea tsunoensis TaxID=53368 RepID=UPI00041DCE08|nr:membrane protein [Hamadaea tsunoensis]